MHSSEITYELLNTLSNFTQNREQSKLRPLNDRWLILGYLRTDKQISAMRRVGKPVLGDEREN